MMLIRSRGMRSLPASALKTRILPLIRKVLKCAITHVLPKRFVSGGKMVGGDMKHKCKFNPLDKWKPIRTIWPYPEGWGVYNKWRETLLDIVPTEEQAQALCDELNSNKG
jgi:hypothetical protein